jgi:hypothetical protein
VLRAVNDGRDHSNEPPLFQVGPWPGGLEFLGKSSIGTRADQVVVRRDGNSLKLSTTVRDADGNLIVQVTDNEWTVPTLNVWDKNYTRDALEVKDRKGRVVFQVKVQPDRVKLQIEWANIQSRLVVGGEMYSERTGIRPMFRYPSSRYWGELDPTSGYGDY